MSTEIVKVPDLGGAADVEVIELCVTKGEAVSEGQTLIVVESDKASMDIPAPFDGVVEKIIVSEGASVSEGDNIVEMLAAGAASEGLSDKTSEELVSNPEPVPAEQEPAQQATVEKAPEPMPVAAESSAPSVLAVNVPDLGGADAVEVIEVAVAAGDTVAEGETILVLESDKASMDMPAPANGTIQELKVSVGDSVGEGDHVADLLAEVVSSSASGVSTASAERTVSPKSAEQKAPNTSMAPTAIPAQASPRQMSTEKGDAKSVHAGPAVRKLARELGVNLSDIAGSGPRDRITKDDLYSFVKDKVNNKNQSLASGIPAVAEIDFSKFGDVEVVPMTKIHKVTAVNMHKSWLNVPHVTQFDDADISDLEDFRNSLKPVMADKGVKLSPLPFVIKVVANALTVHRAFNASLASDGENVIYKNYVHIGMAVDTPSGLMVPVIRDCDKKGIWEIAAEMNELAQKAKDKKLKPAEMQGACFTISSLGNIGGRGFTPIVNTPEVGILGVSRMEIQPVYRNNQFEPRKMLPLSLSYDHRAVNGGDAGRFLTDICEKLTDIRRMIL